ncbi:hypothetical protein B0T16DRAFT_460410 [Cercophora newfieldiana]|uniref:AAA+ ATPase domain-containing protein n=1 Tax=Cercophora newfieldiana TaxID=92897 RepID=A0AA40CME5_9PEZI|nr:hypothetical protein B0T16DRAFT_460410 [Cercophora newfieldiana]
MATNLLEDETVTGAVADQPNDATTRDMATLSRDLARAGELFIKDLEAWRSTIRTHMSALNAPKNIEWKAGTVKNTSSKPHLIRPPSELDSWDYNIPKHPAGTWDDHSLVGAPPYPIIEAFYQTLDPESSITLPAEDPMRPFLLGNSSGIVEGKNLQRVYIRSHYIKAELSLLASSPISQRPMIITPPFKVLLEFLPQLKEKLASLQQQARLLSPQHSHASLRLDGYQDSGNDVPSVNSGNNGDQGTEPGGPVRMTPQTDLEHRAAHLEHLIKFVETDLGDLLELRKRISDASLQSISFDDLWHLFKPGDLVISREEGEGSSERLYRVYFTTGGQIKRRESKGPGSQVGPTPGRMLLHQSLQGAWTPLLVSAYKMEFDGTRVGPKEYCFAIHHFVGKTPITNLPVYPLAFHPGKGCRAYFEARGRKYLSSPGHKSYNGLAVPTPSRPTVYEMMPGQGVGAPQRVSSSQRHLEDISGEVFIDFAEFPLTARSGVFAQLSRPFQDPTETSEHIQGVDSQGNPVKFLVEHSGHEVDTRLAEIFYSSARKGLKPFKPSEEPDSMTGEVFELLGHQVPGYCFQNRQWYLLDVDLVEAIDHDRYSGFEDLVIPDDYKDLLLALVDNHSSHHQKRGDELKKGATNRKSTQIDIVRSKGQGLIVLLHGPPRSGKTSTAETIAAYTRRPLYSLTCGDLGYGSERSELRLDEHASRAEKWGCVLLLDEADVFLMKRDWTEVGRNSLVSVFLRKLEYYSGILFLTTNRPGTIDEAFKSRIHISLRYPSIDLASTEQMWVNIMRRLEKENETAEIKVVFDKSKLLKFAQKHYKRREPSKTTWNGRQIRNAFQTALALGYADRKAAFRDAGLTLEEASTDRHAKKWMRVKLTVNNFKSIAKTTNEFEDYLASLRGKDSYLAREAELRDDDYDPDKPATPAMKNYAPSLFMTRPTVSEALSETGRVQVKRKGKGKGKAKVEESDEDDDEDDDLDTVSEGGATDDE